MNTSRESFLTAIDKLSKERELVPVVVPEVCQTVYLRAMNGTERDAWERLILQHRNTDGTVPLLRSLAFAHLALDEHGHRILTDEEHGKAGELSPKTLDRFLKAAFSASFVSRESVEDVEKNLDVTPGGSGS